MKPRSRALRSTLRTHSLIVLVGGLVSLITSHKAQATPYYWDTNDTTPGFGTASGTWGTSSFWSTDAAGSATTSAISTTTADSINFGNGATGLGAGTITVNGTQAAGDLFFASGSGAILLSGGTITLGAAQTITTDNAADTIGSVIAGAATSLAKAGTGNLTLSGVNTYTGATTISGGILTIGSAGSLGSGTYAGNISNSGTFRYGSSATQALTGILSGTGTMIKSGTSTLTLNPGTGNTSAVGNLSVQAGTVSLTSGTLNVTTGGGANSGSTGNGLTISGSTSVFSVEGGVINTSTYVSTNNGGTLSISSGTFTNGVELLNGYGSAGTVTLSGTGIMDLNVLRVSQGANGVINLNGGTLKTAAITFGGGTGTVNFNGALVQAKTTQSNFTATGFTTNILAGGAKFDTNGLNIAIPNNLLAGAGGGGLTKSGNGTLTLTGTSTYTGPTIISAGTLSTTTIANGGSASGIGQSTNAAANLIINGGTLQYTGGLASSNRNFTIGDTNATLDASGSGALTLSGTASYATADAARTLTLTGTNTAQNTLSSVLANNGTAALSVTKAGVGNWVLTGSNTFTGTTTVNGGTLTLDPGAAPNQTISNIAVNNTGILAINSGSITSSTTLVVSSGGTLNLTGGTLNSTNAYPTVNGTLNISGGTMRATVAEILVSFNTTGGNINLSGSGLLVANQIRMGNGATLSTLNLNGGTLQMNFINGAGNTAGIVNLNGSSLECRSSVGSSFLNANSTYNVLAGGAIFNTAGFNNYIDAALLAGSPSGGLTKNGAGTLTLSGVNTYTGDTVVNAGTLAITGTSIADDNKLVISGGKVNLTGSETVKTLFFGTTQQPAGNYTRADSSGNFTGAGTLIVTSSTAPAGFSSYITGTFANGSVPTGQRGPNDDPDGDGISNLVEYAIAGLDPTASNGAVGTLNGKTISFSKRQPLGSDLTYAIEISTDLGISNPWSSVPPTVNDASTISYTLPDGMTKDFMRLKITQLP